MDEDALVLVAEAGMEREAQQAALAAARRSGRRCRGTASGSSRPSSTIRIWPPCSATKSRPLPSGTRSTTSGDVEAVDDDLDGDAHGREVGTVAGPPARRDGPAAAVAPARPRGCGGDGDGAVAGRRSPTAATAVAADGTPRSPHASDEHATTASATSGTRECGGG